MRKKQKSSCKCSGSYDVRIVGACGGSTSSQATSTEAASEAETEAAESADSDQEAADKVAKLIDDIYVQERTDDTDEQCKAAKEAWDALTDEQKELVEGENADPDYFGRDTGDASLDDPRNQDEIGDKGDPGSQLWYFLQRQPCERYQEYRGFHPGCIPGLGSPPCVYRTDHYQPR